MNNINITLIQSILTWQNTPANLAHFTKQIAAIEETTHIIILPEMFNTGFTMQPELYAETMDGSTIQWMKSTAAAKRAIVCGSIAIKEDGKYYNRLVWMQPDGSFGVYDKRHLFGYAHEDTHYTAGKKRLIAAAGGWKFNLQICYDLRFPVWARQQTADGAAEYDVLIYVANWPQKRIDAWSQLLKARAIENQCYVIGVNRVGTDGNGIYHNGASAVYDAMGNPLLYSEEDEIHKTITLNKSHLQESREKFPFLKDADDFKIVQEY